MRFAEALALPLLHRLDPEDAHAWALRALALAPGSGPASSDALETELWGLRFPNPIGIAAGFDKNATAVRAALRATGAGFMEVGAVTPRPQAGNPRPRLFRLTEDRAVINRFGFNNEGMEAVAARMEALPELPGIVGVNLGANKDSEDRGADFVAVLRRFAECADFFTVNVSSPNTEKLRDLQGKAALDRLLADCLAARDEGAPGKPVLLKIAPDLDDQGLEDVAEACAAHAVDGIIATNTTLSRDGLRSPHAHEGGGLSGAPLFEKSTAMLRRLALLTERKAPLIGVGGVADADQAYAKIKAGASLVQLYSAMVYGGAGLPGRIAEGVAERLARDGFTHVSQAVGADL
ncbi:quinone-dependent dihydroorotate dehydrogenase [Rhodovulum sp. DZ06]|uniref:quinone-dependent dihydroorotate dehydrogenase n=1 Tax=Rhodovulum sp. DZ06 TaxID=3425126 RepID=UPI003D355D62